MTEDEMKTKWCPWARSSRTIQQFTSTMSVTPAPSLNRGYGLDDPCLCLGSACAVWEWDIWAENGEIIKSTTEGYCGNKQ